jgi:hypothetical protein
MKVSPVPKTLGLFAFSAIIYLSLPSCQHESNIIDDLDTVCFDTQILPILQTSCGMMGCHDGTEEGFLAADYQSIVESVIPGDPRGSALYNVVTDINSENMMPPDLPLTLEQRTLIRVWIEQGARETTCTGNNTSGGGNNTDSICFVQDILPMILSSCGTTGCHDEITREEGYVLTDYASILSDGVKPFDANDSKIFEAVTDDGDDRMPPSPRPPLTTAQISALRTWINDGALNSDCPDGSCDTTGTISFLAQVDPLLQGNCVGCHNSTLANGGVNLSSYAQVKIYAESLRDGTSLLAGVTGRLPGFVAMPPTFSLDACNIRLIGLWIEQGSLNN